MNETLSTVAGEDWETSVASFLASALDSEHSRRAYARALDEAAETMDVTCVADVTVKGLTEYRSAILNLDLAPASISQRLAALRSFLNWARIMGLHELNGEAVRAALRLPRSEVRRPYQVLSEPEAAAIVLNREGTRDRALLAVLLGAGLRVSELVALGVRDVLEDVDGQMLLHVASGKGQRSRTVPVKEDVAALLREYLSATGRRMGDDGPLFLAADRAAGRRTRTSMTARSVGHVVAGASEAEGVRAKRVTPHALRHTYALRALRYTGNVMAVAKLLGHAQISTTQRYVDHLGLSELREAVPPLPALAGAPENQPSVRRAFADGITEREKSDSSASAPG